MLDADGSGALDSDEITQAFKLINMPTSKQKIVTLMADVTNGAEDPELDYEGFELLMTRRMNDAVDDNAEERVVAMPFHEIANAFRRKKTLEAFMNGGQDRQRIIDNEHAKQKSQRNLKRWRMPHMRAKMAGIFRSEANGGKFVADDDGMGSGGKFEDQLAELKEEVMTVQEDAEASSKVLDVFTTSSLHRGAGAIPSSVPSASSSSLTFGATPCSRLRSRLSSRLLRTQGGASAASRSGNTAAADSAAGGGATTSGSFRPMTCPPSYLSTKPQRATSENPLRTDFVEKMGEYIPPLTPAPRSLERDFEDARKQQLQDDFDEAFESLKREDVVKLRPQTSAAVNASETRYSAYWTATRKELFEADIVQVKAQIVLAKVKPPKAEVNPWAKNSIADRIGQGPPSTPRTPRTPKTAPLLIN